MANLSDAKMTAMKSILLVEDSPTQAAHLKSVLEGAGGSVFVAEDGLTGIKMAQDLKPDIVILDVQLPDINGFQVAQQLKDVKGTKDIPIIMLTKHKDNEASVLGKQIGVVEYIPKDAFADAVLLETLRQMKLI